MDAEPFVSLNTPLLSFLLLLVFGVRHMVGCLSAELTHKIGHSCFTERHIYAWFGPHYDEKNTVIGLAPWVSAYTHHTINLVCAFDR
jgi:hypothetical protein